MQIPGLSSPLEFTYLAVAIFVAIAIVILYKFVLEPKVQYALRNEEDEGDWTIPLAQLGIMNVGRVVTARRTLQSRWAKAIEATDDEAKKKALIAERDSEMEYHWFAQKSERGKVLYCFDKDPLEPQFHMRQDRGGRFGGETPGRFIQGIRDCVQCGEYDGFTVIGVKLSVEQSVLTEKERNNYELRLEGVSFLRLASENLGKIKWLNDRLKTLDILLDHERAEHAQARSKLDRAVSALEQKTLSTTGEARVPGTVVQKLKEWFTWPQLITAAAFYFIVSPLLMSVFFSSATPPTTTYITAFITVIGFFIIPIFKKIFGRWL